MKLDSYDSLVLSTITEAKMREIQKLFKPDTDAKLSPLPMTLSAEPTVVSAHVKGEDVSKDPSEGTLLYGFLSSSICYF